MGGGPRVVVKTQYCGGLRDREVACSASNFESCVWRTVSSHSSHHPQEVFLAQFSLYVHKGGLKPDSFHLASTRRWSNVVFLLGHSLWWWNNKHCWSTSHPWSAELFCKKNIATKGFFSIWNHHKCLSQLFPIHLNTYVMGLRSVEIF